MNSASVGDVVMWFIVSVVFFKAMDAGYGTDAGERLKLKLANWSGSISKSVIVVLPLAILVVRGTVLQQPFWDIACIACIGCACSPMAFPQLKMELQKLSIGDKILQWVLSRFDLGVKKLLLIAAISWIFSFFSIDWISNMIAIPAYFAPRRPDFLGTFSAAVLAVALFSVALRSLLIVELSKPLAIILLPLSAMLIGYLIDVGASINHAGIPFSVGLLALAIVDLSIFLLGAAGGADA